VSRARRLASNSTGNVIKVKTVVAANKRMPTMANVCPEAVATPPMTAARMSTNIEIPPPRLATGTHADRNLRGAYPLACWIACPTSCAATPNAAILHSWKTGSLRRSFLDLGS
jgi:hypothetical protein